MEEPIEVTIGIERVDNGVIVRWETEDDILHTVCQTDDEQDVKNTNIRRISQDLGRLFYEEVFFAMNQANSNSAVIRMEIQPVSADGKEVAE